MSTFTRDHANALFLLAGIEVLSLHELPNGYLPEREDPWWLAETPFGLVKVGWRSHVLNIDWGATDIREEATEDDVTSRETFVHAWSFAKAVEYLTSLRKTARSRTA